MNERKKEKEKQKERKRKRNEQGSMNSRALVGGWIG